MPVLLIVGGWTWVAAGTILTQMRVAGMLSTAAAVIARLAEVVGRKALTVSKRLQAS